jgi:hypothetical protein
MLLEKARLGVSSNRHVRYCPHGDLKADIV